MTKAKPMSVPDDDFKEVLLQMFSEALEDMPPEEAKRLVTGFHRPNNLPIVLVLARQPNSTILGWTNGARVVRKGENVFAICEEENIVFHRRRVA